MSTDAMTAEGKEAYMNMLLDVPDFERYPAKALGKMRQLEKSLIAQDKAIYDKLPLVIKFKRQFRKKLAKELEETDGDVITVYNDDGEGITHYTYAEYNGTKEEFLDYLDDMIRNQRVYCMDYSPTGLWFVSDFKVGQVSDGLFLLKYYEALDC